MPNPAARQLGSVLTVPGFVSTTNSHRVGKRVTCHSPAIKTALHSLRSQKAPSVALYVVEITFARGFESYLRSHSFSRLQRSAICAQSVKLTSKRVPQLWNWQRPSIRHNVPIDVHRGSDVRVAHQFLLNSYVSSDRIKPGAVRVPVCVSDEMSNSRGTGCPL